MASTNLAQLQQGQAVESNRPKIFQLLDDPRCAKSIAAVAGKYFTADRFLRLAINSIKKTPLLAHCDPQSVLGAFMASAALGLEPNTVQQQAFLIPYKKRRKEGNEWVDTYECQFQIGYRGFITLAHRSEHVASIQAAAIHENDLFEHLMGSESFLRYRVSLKNRGALIGAFCHTRLASGVELATVLPLDEIYKIRSKSETFNALTAAVENASTSKDKAKAQKKLDETPWVMWEDDMAAKSAIKKHAKQLPLTSGDALSAAAQLDDQGEGNTIDLKAMADVDVARSVVEDGEDPPSLEHKNPEYLEPVLGTVQAQPEPLYVDNPAPAPEKTTQASQATQVRQQSPEAEPPFDAGPTVEDALAYVDRGEFDLARDLAHSIGPDAVVKVGDAIAAKAPKAATGRRSAFKGAE